MQLSTQLSRRTSDRRRFSVTLLLTGGARLEWDAAVDAVPRVGSNADSCIPTAEHGA